MLYIHTQTDSSKLTLFFEDTTFFKHFTQHYSHFQTHNIPNCAEEALIFNKNGHESFGTPSYVLKAN